MLDVAESKDTQAISSQIRDTSKHGRRLSQKQIATVLQLDKIGKGQVEIGLIVGCAPSTVCRILKEFGDTRELARTVLEHGSVKLAETVVNTKDAGAALKALGKLDVVREDSQPGGNQVVVMVGTGDRPLEPPTLNIATPPAFASVTGTDETDR